MLARINPLKSKIVSNGFSEIFYGILTCLQNKRHYQPCWEGELNHPAWLHSIPVEF